MDVTMLTNNVPDTYWRQHGCHDCEFCFEWTEYDSGPAYYCTADGKERPLSNSAALNEVISDAVEEKLGRGPIYSSNIDEDDKEFTNIELEMYKDWMAWSDSHQVNPCGKCDQWKIKIEEARTRFVHTCSRNEYMHKISAFQVFDDLLFPSYADRPYHNFNHILLMLDFHNKFGRKEEHEADIVEAAIWFHDLYMNYTNDYNAVKLSADKAVEILDIYEDKKRNKLFDVVMATAHKGEYYSSIEEKIIVSLDLITLGFSHDEYVKYQVMVQTEILPHIVNNPEVQLQKWQKSRSLFLKKMLARDFVFPWESVRNVYEKQARINMQTELDML